MWVDGKHESTHLYINLVLFDGDFPSEGITPLFFEEDADDIVGLDYVRDYVATFDNWEEMETWLNEHPGSGKTLHLSLAIYYLTFEDLTDQDTPPCEFVSLIELKDVRNVNFTNELKHNVEQEACSYLFDYVQEIYGISGAEGELERIRIQGLLNKYDVELYLNKPVTILIGANGIGKTTIIRLIDNLYNINLVDIVSAPFKRMEYTYIEDAANLGIIEDGGLTRFDYEYADFFPDKKAVIDAFEKRMGSPENISNLIEDLDAAGLFGQFIYSLYRKKDFTLKISRIISKWYSESYIRSFDDVIKEIDVVERIIESGDNHVCFEGANIYERLPDDRSSLLFQDANINHPVYYVDFVRPITLDNKLCFESDLISSKTSCLTSNPGTYGNSTLVGCVNKSINSYLCEYPNIYRKILEEKYDEKEVKSERYEANYCNMDILEEMINKRVLLINQLIHYNYYSQDFMLEINNISSDYIKSFFDLLDDDTWEKSHDEWISEYNSLFEEIKVNYSLDYIEYVHPVLIRDSFYSFNMEEFILSDKKTHRSVDKRDVAYLKTLVEYLKVIIPMLKNPDNRSDKVLKYEEYLGKYFIDKQVYVTPCGLRIKNTSQGLDSEGSVFDDDELDLSLVSSGEKKIIVLFALQIFFTGYILLLDEPELSLSLLWQEMLVPDLISCGTNKFVIATHSPYIAKDESIQDYIVYLPQTKE